MKRALMIMVMTFVVAQLFAQDNSASMTGSKQMEDRNFRIPLIGERAPSFIGESTAGTINFPEDFGKKWKILFSHPQDFTPVCSSEILELANLQDEFDKLDTKLVVVSTDLLDTHFQWKKALQEVAYKGRPLVKIKFPLVEDKNLKIAKEYGMIHSSTNSTRDVRGVFIIDPDNFIRAIYFYPMQVGRNTEELIRMVTALQTTAKNSVLTPADWRAGDDVIVSYPPKTEGSDTKAIPEGYYNLAWFMWYKKAN